MERNTEQARADWNVLRKLSKMAYFLLELFWHEGEKRNNLCTGVVEGGGGGATKPTLHGRGRQTY